MTVEIILTKEIGDWWGTPEQFTGMTDDAIVELLKEDIVEFIRGAKWEIWRTKDCKYGGGKCRPQ